MNEQHFSALCYFSLFLRGKKRWSNIRIDSQSHHNKSLRVDFLHTILNACFVLFSHFWSCFFHLVYIVRVRVCVCVCLPRSLVDVEYRNQQQTHPHSQSLLQIHWHNTFFSSTKSVIRYRVIVRCSDKNEMLFARSLRVHFTIPFIVCLWGSWLALCQQMHNTHWIVTQSLFCFVFRRYLLCLHIRSVCWSLVQSHLYEYEPVYGTAYRLRMICTAICFFRSKFYY